jgi:BASS family bile acid:Na+ symporter
MSIVDLITLTLKISILLTLFGFALQVSVHDVTSLFHHPARLLRAIFAMNVVMPVLAVLLALQLNLRPEIEFIIVAFALSPMPPFLPRTQVKAGGDTAHVAGLLTASSLCAVVVIPVAMLLIEALLSRPPVVPVGRVAVVVLTSVLGPLLTGLAMHHLVPQLAVRLVKPVTALGMLLLAASGLAIAAGSFRAMISMTGDGTVVAIAAMVATGLVVGTILGGPKADDRTVLALATAARHPGVALAVTSANFADQKTLLNATLLYLIVSVLMTTPFALWRGRRHAAEKPTPLTRKAA